MTAHHDLDRHLNDFLRDGPDELPYESFDAVRDRTESTRQRVVLGPWRFPEMNKLLAIGLGAAAVIAVLLVGPNLLPSSSSGTGGQPTAAVEPSEVPASVEPSEAPPSVEPTGPADGSLPEGPFLVDNPASSSGRPSISVEIPAPGWTYGASFKVLSKGEDADPPEAAILFWSWPAGTTLDVYGDPCKWDSTRPETPAATPEEIATALAAQALRDASEPVDVTIGGYEGKQITLHVPNDAPTREEAFKDCDGGEFASYGITGGPAGADGLERIHQGPGQVDEFWILDIDGALVIIDAMHRPDTSDELVEEMRTIAESATFE